MKGVDAAWWHMDDPTNLMMITGLLLYDEPVDFEHLREVIEERLLKYKRFRQRVVENPRWFLNPSWQEVPQVDMSYHLRKISLPPPGDEAALKILVSQWMSVPLDATRPLWQIHLIDNYKSGSAILVRMHHCIADGIALVRLLLSLRDDDEPVSVRYPSRRNFALGNSRILIALLSNILKVFSIIRLALSMPDPKTIFKGPLGVSKKAAWSSPLPLSEVKAVGKVRGATINDVLLSTVSGALRRYMESRNSPISPKLNIRAAVPFNLRDPEEAHQLGNDFGLIFLSLPVGIADPLERLEEVKRRSQKLKESPQPVAILGILSLVGRTPKIFEKYLVDFFGTKITAVMTNVPGPKKRIKIAGRPVSGILFWVPQSGRAGMGVSIFSYAGKVWVGVGTDAGLVPEPEEIVDNFHKEFENLKSLLLKDSATVSKQCIAVTDEGVPCMNPALPNSDYCSEHQEMANIAHPTK